MALSTANLPLLLAAQDGQLVDKNDVRAGETGTAKMPIMEFADFNRGGMMDIAFASETGVLSILFLQFLFYRMMISFALPLSISRLKVACKK